MIDDVRPPEPRRRPKPKTIEPLPKPEALPLHEQAKAEEPSFKTPEEIANEEPEQSEPLVAEHEESKTKRFHLSWPSTRKQQILYGVIAVLLAFGIGAGWTLTHHKRAVVAVTTKKATNKKTAPKQIMYSNLSGLPVSDDGVNQRSVTAVMIENSIDARPQSGLSEAGVVYEAVAEGGVTRYMALYQDTQPTNVGPIRSARPYYVQWALGFDAAYAHVGGSPDALSDITAWGVKDMNQFYNGNSYHRVSSRAAPHNVYTGIDTLAQLESSKGYGASSYTPFVRKTDAPYGAKPATGNTKYAAQGDVRTPANSLDFSLSGYTYDPHYDYNAATNTYNRSEAGAAQTDANTGQQLNPKVVIAIVVPLGRGALDSSGAYYSDYNTIGSGTAYVFQDGTVTTAQWQKGDNKANISFTGADGKPLALNRGQTWITAVSSTAGVKYK